MKKNGLSKKKAEKYFFTANIFDEDVLDREAEDDIPPPPVFTQEELEAARKLALMEGKNQGQRETESSLSQHVAHTLERIHADLGALFAAEHLREKLYETDSLKLCLAVFRKLFPAYAAREGFAELKSAITGVIKKQEGQQKILIRVAPGLEEPVSRYLATLKSPEGGPDLLVKPDGALAPGACTISWQDGGGARDPDALAAEIAALVEQMLAGNAPKGHDRGESTPAPAAQTEPVEKPE